VFGLEGDHSQFKGIVGIGETGFIIIWFVLEIVEVIPVVNVSGTGKVEIGFFC
jgi:hypothetical protein